MKEEEIEVEFVEKEDIPEIYASGVFGGLTPRGDLNIDLIRERNSLPEKEIRNIEDGNVVRREGGGKIIREIQARVFMDRSSAFSTATWILEKVLESKQATQKNIRNLLKKEYGLEMEEK